MRVVKRNGSIVEFDKNRIISAIEKAMNDVNEVNIKTAKEIADKIQSMNVEQLKVEEIEKQVVKELFLRNLDDVADSYSEYKAQRKLIRNTNQDRYNGKFLSNEFLSKYKHQPNPFPTELGKFVYYRTYSRPIPEEHRREDWWETVFRVVEFNSGLQLDAMQRQGIPMTEKVLGNLKKESEEIYDLMYNLKLFPSGRTLWVGGSKSSYLYPLSNFNCSFVTIDSLDKFSEIFFVLMLGTGVGLSVERKYVSKLPKINTKIEVIHKSYDAVPKNERKEYTELKLINNNAIEIEIGDSKFGWSNAINMYFDIISSKQYVDIEYIFINYNNVRPEGERLKTFGGYASGHGNIKQMFEKINHIFKDKKQLNGIQWQTIKPIDCLDIATIIAENVVSGGVRRSAEIIFCDNDEEEVLNAKANLYYQDDNGNWISNDKILNRMLSNNTVLYQQKPTREELHNHFEKLKVSGEPAFGNFEEMKRRREDVQGGNPCFTGNMKLLTVDGYKTFEELCGKNIKLINKDGDISDGKVWCSGEKDIYEIKFANKQTITCTTNHKFMLIDGNECKAKDLKKKRIMPYLEYHNIYDEDFVKYGFIQGDGGLGRLSSQFHTGLEVNIGKDDADIEELFGIHLLDGERTIYINGFNNDLAALGFSSNSLPTRDFPTTFTQWTEFQQKSFLRGCYSANGSVIKTDGRITYKTTCKKFAEQLKTILKNMGYAPYITTNKKHDVEFSNGIYECKESYDINISQYQSKLKFYNEIGFVQNYKMEKLKTNLINTSPMVYNVKNLNKKEKVYDFSEPLIHWGVVEGFIAHNCFEIMLRDRGVCNLTEVNLMGFVNPDGTFDKDLLLKAQKYSAHIGYRMASIELELHTWNLVNTEDRLTGCSITGVMDFKNATNITDNEFELLLKELREVARNSAFELADFLKMNRPKLVTAIKPSGTISQLPTVSSGVHFSHSPYYIRRVRVNAQDPLAKAMASANFTWNPEVGQTVDNHKTKVFEFPIKAPEGRTKYDVSAIEQLELYKMIMKNYVDHNASNTIHVRPNEWDEVEQWVYDNWDYVVGITFLSLDDNFYQLLPYEAITKEQYKELLTKQPKFNPSILKQFEKFDEEFDILDADCDSGVCPIR